VLAALKVLRAYIFALGARVRSVGAVTRYTGIKTRFHGKSFFRSSKRPALLWGPSSQCRS